MTDNEIIKALERCSSQGDCDKCPAYKPSSECIAILQKNALDLINRQKAENEMLEGLVNHQRNLINELNGEIYRKGLL